MAESLTPPRVLRGLEPGEPLAQQAPIGPCSLAAGEHHELASMQRLQPVLQQRSVDFLQNVTSDRDPVLG